jgi:hypothetical protein
LLINYSTNLLIYSLINLLIYSLIDQIRWGLACPPHFFSFS